MTGDVAVSLDANGTNVATFKAVPVGWFTPPYIGQAPNGGALLIYRVMATNTTATNIAAVSYLG